MRALFKSSIILALLAVSVYLYWSQSQDFFAPPKPKALIAPVDPAAKAEEELDYLVAKRIGSLREWQAFLTAHGSGFYAQSARAEVERLLHAEKTPGPVAAEVSNSASPSVTAAIGAERPAEPSAGLQVVTPTQDEICRRDEERLERLRNGRSSEEAVRFANELGCERLRPQLLGLMETLGMAPAPAAAEVSNSVSPDAKPASEAARPAAPSPGSEVVPSAPDEICKRDEERLVRLSPSSDEVARFANELGCERLRPQLLGLMETLGMAPAPAAAEVSNSVSPDAKPASEAARPAAPSPGSEVVPSAPDEICKRDEERLVRLRNSPSSDEVARFANELGCATLRPQLLRLVESLGSAATTPASASQSRSVKGSFPAEKASAPAKPEAAAAPVDPAGTAAIDEELDYWAAQKVGSLDGWRSFLAAHGSGIYAQAARTEMQKLLPAEKASAPAKPEGTGAASPDGNALAAYPRGTEAASFTPDDICKRDGDRLARLRDSRSSEEAARFANELGCEKLRPQLLGLMESWGRVASAPALAELPNGSSLDAKAAGVAPGTTFAVEYEHGATAYNRGEFATAKRLWLPLAEQGDARAQLGLALMYFLGQGVQVNMAAALDWCQKAADHGLVAAQYELGQIYEHPWRPELQDFAEAAKWYEKAADQGYADAQDELGGMYEFGLGVTRDYSEAEKWFVKAGDLVSIAKMYASVGDNHRMAAKWYRKLADQGNKDAEFRLGEMYRNGTGRPARLCFGAYVVQLGGRVRTPSRFDGSRRVSSKNDPRPDC